MRLQSIYFKRFLTVVFSGFLLCSCAFAEIVHEAKPIPEILRFTQHTVETQINPAAIDRRVYPDTENQTVNQEIADMVDTMAKKAIPCVPTRRGSNGDAVLDTGASVQVTGTKVASFLILSHILYDQDQTYVDFDTRVYDLETGSRITLSDIVTARAESTLKQKVRRGVTAYFPEEEPEQLDSLLDNIMDAKFTLSPAYLILHFRADTFYPGKNTLIHVKIPYRELQEYLTEFGKEQTDNSGYRTIAFTFDDGPARGTTQKMLQVLRERCATATFFNLGSNLLGSPDCIKWEHDAGHAVESHTYHHNYKLNDAKNMMADRDRFKREQEQLIGIGPVCMRAPGGNDKLYSKWRVGMPIIRWNCLTGDAAEKVSEQASHATFIHTLKDHTIALMHDIRFSSVSLAKYLMDEVSSRGYMFVTVEELFEMRGIPIKKNVVYFGNE